MIDKREWRRIEVDLPAMARSAASEIEKPVRIVDINYQGVCFAADREFLPGEKVELQVEVKELPGLKISTETVWSGFIIRAGHYRVGARLDPAMPFVDRERFLKYYNFLLIRMKTV